MKYGALVSGFDRATRADEVETIPRLRSKRKLSNQIFFSVSSNQILSIRRLSKRKNLMEMGDLEIPFPFTVDEKQ